MPVWVGLAKNRPKRALASPQARRNAPVRRTRRPNATDAILVRLTIHAYKWTDISYFNTADNGFRTLKPWVAPL
jgi:hypothetical protein